MNITPEAVADIAKIYHEHYELMDELSHNLADSRSRETMQKNAEYIINNFIPRCKKIVPKEVQKKLGLSLSALENNILITAGLKK